MPVILSQDTEGQESSQLCLHITLIYIELMYSKGFVKLVNLIEFYFGSESSNAQQHKNSAANRKMVQKHRKRDLSSVCFGGDNNMMEQPWK